MNKRYFLIILIICVCCINLYVVSNVSDVVGTASVDVGEYTFSLPKGFSLYDSDSNKVLISNPDTNMEIRFYSSVYSDDNFSSKYDEINSSDFKILSSGTIDNNGIIIQSIYYQNEKNNRSTFYFNKDNHDFEILIVGFNYDLQKNQTIDIVCGIVDSIRANYKVPKS